MDQTKPRLIRWGSSVNGREASGVHRSDEREGKSMETGPGEMERRHGVHALTEHCCG